MKEADVQEANRRFYESIASVYDQVDPRRADSSRLAWLEKIISEMRAQCPGSNATFADLGAGSGLLSLMAAEHFPKVLAVDISPAMLARIKHPKVEIICAPCEALPLSDSSVDACGLFATLHHVYDPLKALREAHRVLKPGGVLYSDHDIEESFVRNFRWPLSLYRALFDHGRDYLRLSQHSRPEDYALSEFHGEKGVPGVEIERELRELGFSSLTFSYHWQGLLPLTPPWKRRGLSPLLRIEAVK